MSLGWLIVLAIIVVIAAFLILTYNRLVTLRQRVNEAFSDIDVQLKRRHDLIPNLIETVKGYAAHERGVFDEVTRARAGAVAAGSQGPQERAQAENVLTGALRSLFAVAEAYPQLQAVQEFKDLSENLRDTEDKIQFSRRFYNGQVRDYNTALQTFPTVALAGMFGFKASEYFEVEELVIGAGIPKPKIYVIEDSAPNAFATGRDPKHSSVAVTRGLLTKLDRTELQGVLAHELSHVRNFDIRLMLIVAVLLGMAALLSDWIFRSMFWGGRGRDRDRGGGGGAAILIVVALALAILTPIIAQLIQLAVSRQREYVADASGALLTRYPSGPPSCLRKLAAR